MDKSLLFFMMALLCFWLVLSEFYGDKYISKFVTGIMPASMN